MGTFATAWNAFWAILRSEEKAEAWRQLEARAALPETTVQPTPEASAATTSTGDSGTGALHLLGLLQREDRFIDFLQEDLTPYSDEQVGAAARKVHDDCRRTIERCFAVEPVRTETEGARVEVPSGFDPRQLKVTGHPVGNPPFQGALVHRGWTATKAELPRLNSAQEAKVLCPAEVEI
ncbi:MAG: DUF2760 domain-containing protein, partial [Victivallales bacterium]|nr:DUF2760 domain-containing protein [Victivallales bacterium]